MKKNIKIVSILLVVCMSVALLATLCACNPSASAKAIALDEISLTSESYAFAVKKGNATLLDTANELLAELESSGELEQIINSFFDGSATYTHTNPVSKDGCLVVATNAYFPPFEYYSGNALTGIDIQIAQKLAQKLGKQLYVDDMEFDAIITSVSSGLADIAMAGLTINDERKKQVDFSNEYYESAQVLIVKEGDTTFDGCTSAEQIEQILAQQNINYIIGAQKGTTGYMYSAGDVDFGYDGFKNLTTTGYDTGALAVQDLINGKINAVIIDKMPAIMITKAINK